MNSPKLTKKEIIYEEQKIRIQFTKNIQNPLKKFIRKIYVFLDKQNEQRSYKLIKKDLINLNKKLTKSELRKEFNIILISRVGWDQKKRKEFLNDIFNKKSPIPISIVQGGSPGLGKGKSWRKQVQPIQLGHGGVDLVILVKIWKEEDF